MAVSHLWDRFEKCHKGFPGLFVKFRGGSTRALGLAQQGDLKGALTVVAYVFIYVYIYIYNMSTFINDPK